MNCLDITPLHIIFCTVLFTSALQRNCLVSMEESGLALSGHFRICTGAVSGTFKAFQSFYFERARWLGPCKDQRPVRSLAFYFTAAFSV